MPLALPTSAPLTIAQRDLSPLLILIVVFAFAGILVDADAAKQLTEALLFFLMTQNFMATVGALHALFDVEPAALVYFAGHALVVDAPSVST